MLESLSGFAAAAAPGAPGPSDRVTGPQQVTPLLTVAGPQFGAQNGTGNCAGDHPSHDYRALIIEPDEVRRTPPDRVAHQTVIAVGHPPLGLDRRRHPASKFFRSAPAEIAPSWLPVDRIQLDVWQLQ